MESLLDAMGPVALVVLALVDSTSMGTVRRLGADRSSSPPLERHILCFVSHTIKLPLTLDCINMTALVTPEDASLVPCLYSMSSHPDSGAQGLAPTPCLGMVRCVRAFLPHPNKDGMITGKELEEVAASRFQEDEMPSLPEK